MRIHRLSTFIDHYPDEEEDGTNTPEALLGSLLPFTILTSNPTG